MIKMKRFNAWIAALLLTQFVLVHLNIAAQEKLTLLGNRFLTFSTVVRVNQIETSRDQFHGTDESGIHSPEGARKFRETIENSWPGARITWSFSWLALKDQRQKQLSISRQMEEMRLRKKKEAEDKMQQEVDFNFSERDEISVKEKLRTSSMKYDRYAAGAVALGNLDMHSPSLFS